MVIQIIEEGPKKLTTGQKLGAGFQQALGVIGEHQQQEKQFSRQMQLQEMKGKQALAEKLAGQKPGLDEATRSQIVSKALSGEATPEEISQLPATDQLRVASLQKPAKPTQASQPIAPEQLDKIKDVRQRPEFQEATPSKKYQMLTDAGVSKENAKAEADVYATEYETGEKRAAEEREYQYKYHKESEDFATSLQKENKSAINQLDTIKKLEKSIGKVSPKNFSNIMKGFGPIGDKLANAFLSKDAALISAAIPEFLEGRKELFGVRLSDADLRLLSDKLIDPSKPEEANRALLKIAKKAAEQAQIRYQIGQEITKKNKGLRPLNFANDVEEKYEQVIKPVAMISGNGNEVEIPAYQVSSAIANGWKIAGEE